MPNQELQIEKIQAMLENSDFNFFELGFQLMESLELKQEVLKNMERSIIK